MSRNALNNVAKMLKKCYFCKKMVLITSNSNRSLSESSRNKKVRIVGVRFKESPFITIRQTFSNHILPTRTVCKKCKTKTNTLKTLNYLMQSLSKTISEGYDIKADTELCSDDVTRNIDDETGNDQFCKSISEFDENLAKITTYKLMTEKETQFSGGTFQKIDNIAVQQETLKEFFDSTRHDIVYQPELLRQFYENEPEQQAERQQLIQGHDEKIAELLADQKILLQRIEERVQRQKEGDVPQHLVEQQGLRAGDIYRPEQIEGLERPEDDRHELVPLALQPRLMVVNADPSDLIEIRRTRRAIHAYPPVRGNHDLIQLMYQRGMFQEAVDNVAMPLSMHLIGTFPYGYDKLPNSFSHHQTMPPEEDDTIQDLLMVHRTLLQEDDDIEDSDGKSQDTAIDEQEYLQEDNSDILELLNVLEKLTLDESNEPSPISVEHQFSSDGENSSSDSGLPQDFKYNVNEQQVASKILSEVKDNLQNNTEQTEQDILADDANQSEINTITQNLLTESENICLDQITVQHLLQEDDDVILSDQKNEKPFRNNDPLEFTEQIRPNADKINLQEQSAMQPKLLSICTTHQELLQEGKDIVQKPILDQQTLRERDNTSLQQIARPIGTGNCENNEQTDQTQEILLNNNLSRYRLIVHREAFQEDGNKVKVTICLENEMFSQVDNNAAEQEEILKDDKNMSPDLLAAPKTSLQQGDDNIHKQINDDKNFMRDTRRNTREFEFLSDDENTDIKRRRLETVSPEAAQDSSNENNDEIIVEVVDKPITCLGKRVRSIEGETRKIRKMSLEDSITTRRGE